MNKMIIMACVALGYFLLLYMIALISNRHYRSDEDVFWISKNQWNAIFVMWVPCLIAIAKGAER